MAISVDSGDSYWDDSDEFARFSRKDLEGVSYDLSDVVCREDIFGSAHDWSSLSTDRSSELLREFHSFWRQFSSLVGNYNRLCKSWESLHDMALSVVQSPEERPYTVAVAVSILQTLAASFAMLARSALSVSRASDVWQGALEKHIDEEDECRLYLARALVQKMAVMQDAVVKAATESE